MLYTSVKFVFNNFLYFVFISVPDEQDPVSNMGYVLQLCPQLDVLGCIKEAVQTDKLVLTLPWVVKYLSMMDPVSAHLPYYSSVFEQLFGVYQDMHLSGRASLLIRLLLGWLFESSNFLQGLFYAWKQDPSISKTLNTGYYSLPRLSCILLDCGCLG